MKFNYYGHSAFTLSDDVTTILFDPFITENPWTQVSPTDIHCQYIIVTHCHGDHYGDTEAIAKANDATVISTAEVAGKAGEAGCKAHAMRQARLFRRRHRPLLGHENPRSLRADRLRHPAYWR